MTPKVSKLGFEEPAVVPYNDHIPVGLCRVDHNSRTKPPGHILGGWGPEEVDLLPGFIVQHGGTGSAPSAHGVVEPGPCASLYHGLYGKLAKPVRVANCSRHLLCVLIGAHKLVRTWKDAWDPTVDCHVWGHVIDDCQRISAEDGLGKQLFERNVQILTLAM
jgi:hypothetical protein